jgi:hypothetical protein
MIADPEVQLLAAISAGLQPEYEGDDDLAWTHSPFGWIKKRPSRQKGAIGEKIVAGWCAARDFNVERSPDSDADRIIEGLRTEIKFSTLWKNGGYTFQQIRDQNYDVLVCLGVSPFNAHCWVFRKEDIRSLIGSASGLTPQHGGSRGTDTAWLHVDPDSPHIWLSPHGGSLKSAIDIWKSMVGL